VHSTQAEDVCQIYFVCYNDTVYESNS